MALEISQTDPDFVQFDRLDPLHSHDGARIFVALTSTVQLSYPVALNETFAPSQRPLRFSHCISKWRKPFNPVVAVGGVTVTAPLSGSCSMGTFAANGSTSIIGSSRMGPLPPAPQGRCRESFSRAPLVSLGPGITHER